MPDYIVKHGGIWSGGKLVPTGGTVTLDEDDRKYIDPHGEFLISAAEAKAEAEAKKKEAAELAKKAAELEAAAKKKAEDDAKKHGGGK